MQVVLESVIKKAPKHDGGILYRFLTPNDNEILSVGDLVTFDHSLTTTTEDWKQDEHTYIITPLPKAQTNAYDLYKIYNHGDETQVNFLAGSKFRVSKVEITDQEKRVMYLDEVL